MGRRNDVDWDAVERDYRLGQFTLRQIAKKHGLTAGSISRKASKHKWVQDLTDEIREKTRAALNFDATQSNIEAAVQTNVRIVREHQVLIGRTIKATNELIGELESSEIALPAKTIALGNLANSVKTLIGLERQAFNLSDGDGDTTSSKLDIRWMKDGK